MVIAYVLYQNHVVWTLRSQSAAKGVGRDEWRSDFQPRHDRRINDELRRHRGECNMLIRVHVCGLDCKL